MAPLETAPDPYLNMTGDLTPLFHLEREAKFHAPALDDVCLPSGISIGTQNSLSELERNPEFPASPRHEALAPAPTREESQEAPHNSKRVLTSQKLDERLPQVPVATRGNPNFLLHLEKHLEIPPSMRIEVSFPYRDSRAILCSPSQLE